MRVVNDEKLGEHLRKSRLLPILATDPAGTVVLSGANLAQSTSGHSMQIGVSQPL